MSKRSNIDAALTHIGTTNLATLFLRPAVWDIGATNLTIPANVTLRMSPGATLVIGTGLTLTINGPFEAGLYQVFDCAETGAVVFGKNVKEVYPEWWAVNTTPGTTDMSVAINAALNGITTGYIKLTDSIYAISTTILPATTSCPVLLSGFSDHSTMGTRIKWIGGNDDSMIRLARYMRLANLYLYNGNSSTGLIGVDSIASGDDYTTAFYVINLDHIQVAGCAYGYAFNNTYEVTANDCFAADCTTGYDIRNVCTVMNFNDCHIMRCYTGITDKTGTGILQFAWNRGTIEGCYTYGIDMAAVLTNGCVFRDTYFEANTQHRLSERIRLLNIFVDHDGEVGHCYTAPGVALETDNPPFDITSSVGVVLDVAGIAITAGVALATFSGTLVDSSSTSYAGHAISLPGPVARSSIALALFENNILMFGKIKPADYTILETPYIDASAAYQQNIMALDELWKGHRLGLPVDAYLVVETGILTNGSFTIGIGRTAANYTDVASYTYSGANPSTIAAGTYRIGMTEATPTALFTYAYPYLVKTSAETSGRFKVVLILV